MPQGEPVAGNAPDANERERPQPALPLIIEEEAKNDRSESEASSSGLDYQVNSESEGEAQVPLAADAHNNRLWEMGKKKKPARTYNYWQIEKEVAAHNELKERCK